MARHRPDHASAPPYSGGYCSPVEHLHRIHHRSQTPPWRAPTDSSLTSSLHILSYATADASPSSSSSSPTRNHRHGTSLRSSLLPSSSQGSHSYTPHVQILDALISLSRSTTTTTTKTAPTVTAVPLPPPSLTSLRLVNTAFRTRLSPIIFANLTIRTPPACTLPRSPSLLHPSTTRTYSHSCCVDSSAHHLHHHRQGTDDDDEVTTNAPSILADLAHSAIAPLVRTLRFEAPPCAFGCASAFASASASASQTAHGDGDGDSDDDDDDSINSYDDHLAHDDDNAAPAATRPPNFRPRLAVSPPSPPPPLSHHLSHLTSLHTLCLTMTHPTSAQAQSRSLRCPSHHHPLAPLPILLATLMRTLHGARLPRLETALLTLPYEGAYDANFFGAPCLAAAALLDERVERGERVEREQHVERDERAEHTERGRTGRGSCSGGSSSSDDKATSGKATSPPPPPPPPPPPSTALARVAVKLADRSGNFTVMRVR